MADEMNDVYNLCYEMIRTLSKKTIDLNDFYSKNFKIDNNFYMKIIYGYGVIRSLCFYKIDNIQAGSGAIPLDANKHQIYNCFYENLEEINKRLPEDKKLFSVDDLKLLIEEIIVKHA